MHRHKALVYRMSRYFKTRQAWGQTSLSTAWYDLFEIIPPATNWSIHRMIRSKYGKAKRIRYLKHNLQTRFTRESVTEYGRTAESGSMKKEQTLSKMANLSDWIKTLIHRMISFKTTQKPASTTWYRVRSIFTQKLTRLNPQHVAT
jgi:hypothetical protein